MPRYRRAPKLAVDAFWPRAGKLLLVRRGREPFRGRWALPGGYVEPDESVEEAVARELREETGLVARPVRLVGVYSRPGRDPRGPNASVVFEMRGRPAVPKGGDDASDAKWWPLSELPPLAFDHEEIVRDGLAAATSGSRRSRRTGRRSAFGRGGSPRRSPRGGSGR